MTRQWGVWCHVAMTTYVWPPEKVNILTKLWGTLPAADIGKRLGCTRNAVIGKANRLGLKNLRSDGDYRLFNVPMDQRPPRPVYEKLRAEANHKVFAFMAKHKITGKEIARFLGLSEATVSQAKTGRHPLPLTHCQKILDPMGQEQLAKALGLAVK